MFVEFQIVVDQFLVGFGNQLRMLDLCSPETFVLPDSPCSDNTMLDRIVFGDPAIAQSDTVGTVLVEVPTTLFLVEIAELPANGAEPTGACQEVRATLRFGLGVDVGTAPALTIDFAGLDAPDLSADASGALGWLVLGVFTPVQQPFDLGPLSALLGATPSVTEAGIAAAADGSRVAIRFVLSGALSGKDWQAFHNGGFAPIAAAGWAVYVGRELVEDALEARMSEGLEQGEADGKIAVESAPDATLMPWLANPMALVTFEIEAIDACVCLWGEIDLDVDVTATLLLSVPEPDVLQTDLYLAWDLDDAEVVCCAITATAFWFLIGTNLLQEGQIGWGEFLGGLVLQPFVFSATLFGAHGLADEQIGANLPDGWDEVTEGTHYRMRGEVAASPLGLATTLESVTQQANGLVLAGSLTGGVGKRHQPVVEALVTDTFGSSSWIVEDVCAATSRVVVQARFRVRSVPPDPSVSIYELVPLTICDLRVVDDPQNQFTPYLKSEGGNSYSITVPLSGRVAEYLAAPYPCRVRVVTSGGVRVLDLGSLPPITDEELDELFELAQTLRLTECADVNQVDERFWNDRLFLPRWLPDPPPDVERYLQQWNVVVAGLLDGELLEVRDLDGAKLATLTGMANSPPAAELLVDLPASRTHRAGIGLRRSSTTLARRREVVIQELVLSRVATIAVGLPVVGVCAVAGRGGPAFGVATAHGVGVYRVPAAPRLVDYLTATGLRGVLPWRDGVLAWGTGGVHALGTAHPAPALPDGPVRAACLTGPRLHILGDDLRVHDRAGRVIARAAGAGATALAVSGGVVLLAGPDRLRLLDGLTLATLDEVRVEHTTALAATRYAGARAAFFCQIGERTTVYAVHRHDGLTPVAEYTRLPLLAHAIRNGRRYAALEPDQRTVAIYEAGRSARRGGSTHGR